MPHIYAQRAIALSSSDKLPMENEAGRIWWKLDAVAQPHRGAHGLSVSSVKVIGDLCRE
jgi:hypothetical protein